MASNLPPVVPVFPGMQFNGDFYTPNELPISYERMTETFVQYPNAQGDVSMQSAFFSGNVVIDGDLSVNGTINGSGGGGGGGSSSVVTTLISEVEGSIDLSNNLTLSNTADVVNVVTYDSITRSSPFEARALGTGLNGICRALLMDGSTLYAAGSFSSAGGVNVTRIAQWKNGVWSAVGNDTFAGDTDNIRALCMHNRVLYAGGNVPAKRVIQYDGANWSTLPNMTIQNGIVLSLQTYEGFLYIGGTFTLPYNRVMRYHLTTKTVDTALQQLNGDVFCMVFADGSLIIGGSFATSPLNRVARILSNSTTSWTPLGTGITNGIVFCMAYDSTMNVLYVGGTFTSPFNYTAMWNFNTNTWSGLTDATYTSGLNGNCYSMCFDEVNKKLYVTGIFTNIGTRLAVWDATTSTWSSFGNVSLGTPSGNAILKDTSTSLNRVYVGGEFVDINVTDPVTNQTVQQTMRYIAAVGELKPKVNLIVNNENVASISQGETKPVLIAGGEGYALATVPSSAF